MKLTNTDKQDTTQVSDTHCKDNKDSINKDEHIEKMTTTAD